MRLIDIDDHFLRVDLVLLGFYRSLRKVVLFLEYVLYLSGFIFWLFFFCL